MRQYRESPIRARVWKRLSAFAITVSMASVALAVGLLVRPLAASRSARAETGYEPAPEVLRGQVSKPEGVSGQSLTSESVVSGAIGKVDAVELTASNFRRDGNYLLTDICFKFPGGSDWTIWSASLRYEETLVMDWFSTPIEVRRPEVDGTQSVVTFVNGTKDVHTEHANKGDTGGRCDTLSFELPADSKPHEYVLTIDSIAAAPSEGESCKPAALERVQAALNSRSVGITVGCVITQLPGGGTVEGFSILARPARMAQDQAEAIVFSNDVFLDAFGIRGPWTFAVPLDR